MILNRFLKLNLYYINVYFKIFNYYYAEGPAIRLVPVSIAIPH